MRLLVLGGTHLWHEPSSRRHWRAGDEVTTLNRGMSGPAATETDGSWDRTGPEALRAALGDREWDAIIDTWSRAPRVVRDVAGRWPAGPVPTERASSRSVHQWPIPIGADEHAPLVDADPDRHDAEDYAAAKRGGEPPPGGVR